ncbi:MAG: hypothetical protein Q9216_002067 [Gyalolechia sp. 2 TL-2023]
MERSEDKPFKVIVVGGGIAGLLMSHALGQAGIDHVIYEKRESILNPEGASFGIWPHAARIVDQLGLWPKVQEMSIPMKMLENRAPDGSLLHRTNLFEKMTSRHGYDFLVLERQQFMKMLYENLPDKNRVVVGKSISDYINRPDSVRVVLDDGSYDDGDILVGCDGVNSKVREIMWGHANTTTGRAVTAIEKRSLRTEYCCLLGVAPLMPGMELGNMTVTSHRGFSLMIMTQSSQTFFFVNIKLTKPLAWPNQGRYTVEQTEKEAARFATLPVAECILFGELWKRRLRGHLYPLEECVFNLWHFERTVLVGDCVHKMTPVLALGGSCTLESVAVLVNEIKNGVSTHPRSKPNASEIDNIFHRYQTAREARVRMIYQLTYENIRSQARDGIMRTLYAPFAALWIDDAAVADRFSALVRVAPKFDFLPKSQRPSGSIGFDDDTARAELPPGNMLKKPSRDQHWSENLNSLFPHCHYLMSLLLVLWGLCPKEWR